MDCMTTSLVHGDRNFTFGSPFEDVKINNIINSCGTAIIIL